MDILIIGLWMILFLAIPLTAIFVAGNSHGRQAVSQIIGKLLITFFFYLVTTIISFMYSVIMVYHAGSIHEANLTIAEQIIGLSAVYFYGIAGYLLCSFINGSFLKPWQMAFFNSKKPLSISDTKPSADV